jgi:hypothetical protein
MTTLNFTVEETEIIVERAKEAARKAAVEFFHTKLNGVDQFACGFAWVNICGIKGNTRMGKVLKQAGLKQDYSKAFSIWNPSGHSCQNVDTKEAGAEAAAQVLRDYGFEAYAGSRLD